MVVHGPYPVGEPRVAREAQAAIDAGFEVDVVAMKALGETRSESVDGARVLRMPHLRSTRSGAGSLLYEYGGFSALAASRVARLHLARRYGVVQVHNPPDFLIAAAFLPRWTGARVVFDVHDLAPELFAMRLGTRPGARSAVRTLRAFESLAMRSSDAVVTVHEPYRRELLKRGVPDEKIVVVLNALDERLVPPAPPPQGDGRFRIVYHGTVTWHYGVDLLVDAVASLAGEVPEAQLQIFGDGDAIPGVRERVKARGIEDRVEINGRILPQAQVLQRISGASLGVVSQLPIQRNESALPTKLMEYVAMRIPVVAPDVPAIRSSFGEDEVVFFRGGDVESLAAAIRVVARDSQAAEARAAAARRRYESEYSWPLYAARYVDLLERLLV